MPSVYTFRTTGKHIGNPDLDRPYHFAQTTVRKMLENQEDAHEQAVREFVAKAQQYVQMPTPASELLRTFIRKIEVYKKTEKYFRTCGNPVVIYCKLQMKKLETLSVMFSAYEEDAEKDIPA